MNREEKRVKKLKDLIGNLDTALVQGEAVQAELDEVLRRTAKSLESNAIYQAWKSRN